MYGAVGVIGGLTVWVACTLSSGMVGRCLGGTVGGGIDVENVSQCGTLRVGGFAGGILAGMMVVWALGLQLLATTVSSSTSLLERI